MLKMHMKWMSLFAALLASPAIAQQLDPAKLAPMYRQQRDMANDQIAACAASLTELQAKVTELEKKLSDIKVEPPKENK